MTSATDLSRILTVMVSLGLSAAQITLGASDHCVLWRGPVRFDQTAEVDHGGVVGFANCYETVELNKCQGTCDSATVPSVNNNQGFRKICRCCRESATRPKTVYLRCRRGWDELDNYRYPLVIREITACQCTPCND